MRQVTTIVGILLIVVGILAFSYQGYTYNKKEEVAKFGDLQITAQTKERVQFPPWFGGLCLAGGIIILIVGQINRK